MNDFTKEQLLKFIEDLKEENLRLSEQLSVAVMMAAKLHQELIKREKIKTSVKDRH